MSHRSGQHVHSSWDANGVTLVVAISFTPTGQKRLPGKAYVQYRLSPSTTRVKTAMGCVHSARERQPIVAAERKPPLCKSDEVSQSYVRTI